MQEQFNELNKRVKDLEFKVEQLEKGIDFLEHMMKLTDIQMDVRFNTVNLKLMDKQDKKY